MQNVTRQFGGCLRDPRVSFLGNVRLGSPALSLPELRAHYNAVVLACGAEGDRRLRVPGGAAPGVHPAREFVWWYNAHPAAAAAPFDLRRARSVAVCGLGNVAVDCARVLLQPPARLAATDAAAHAVGALRGSGVREVHLVGRRGPAQAAFTPKELRELVGLEGVKVVVTPGDALAALGPACAAELGASRVRRRAVEVLRQAVEEGEGKGKGEGKHG
jgi:adrenodoxin-NADP+ reductase